MRTDRNNYSRNLTEATEEIARMEREFKKIFHEIEQLKEEIREKDRVQDTRHHNLFIESLVQPACY